MSASYYIGGMDDGGDSDGDISWHLELPTSEPDIDDKVEEERDGHQHDEDHEDVEDDLDCWPTTIGLGLYDDGCGGKAEFCFSTPANKGK
jgi:hypothetical protein